jgi:hypothetical protein
MMAYAETTRVPIVQTRHEIEKLLTKHGAEGFGYMQEGSRAIVAFRMKRLSYRFILAVPDGDQAARSKWRALLLVIKARLEGVAASIETIEEAFLANTVMQGGETIWERARPEIITALKDGRMPERLALEGPR